MKEGKLPTWNMLRDIPLRAIVAYAVRHARRVQPLVGAETPALEQGLDAAECFCRAEPTPSFDFQAADEITRTVGDHRKRSNRGHFAAHSAALTFRAVDHAIEASNDIASLLAKEKMTLEHPLAPLWQM
jgi:hypothetical protein